ncbi:hypothetical protein HYV86_06010 [Candidatus Woesearchaeota archaeon]|nr:hypothetical protein [Candidatus Woesearchaeota archaeon]
MTTLTIDDAILLDLIAGKFLKELSPEQRARVTEALEARAMWGDGPRTVQKIQITNPEHSSLFSTGESWHAYAQLLHHGRDGVHQVVEDPQRARYSAKLNLSFVNPVNPTELRANLALYRADQPQAWQVSIQDRIGVLTIDGTSFYCGDHKGSNLTTLTNFIKGPEIADKGNRPYIRGEYLNRPIGTLNDPIFLPPRPVK